MANIASQKKRILRTARERAENRRTVSPMRTAFRRLEAAVEAGDAEAVKAEHRTTTRLVDKAVKSGALHSNTGARRKARASRLAKRVSA